MDNQVRVEEEQKVVKKQIGELDKEIGNLERKSLGGAEQRKKALMDRLNKRKEELSKLDAGVDKTLTEEIDAVAKDSVHIDSEIDGLATKMKKDRSKLQQRL